MERIGRSTAVLGGVRELADDLVELDERARPAMSDDERQRVLMRRARVHEVDGHDPGELAAAAEPSASGRPLVVIARTDPCRGMELLRPRTPKLHYVRFKSEEERSAYERVLAEMSGC